MKTAPSKRQAWHAYIPGALFKSDLSTGARMVYCALCFHANRDGTCYPCQRTLVSETGAGARSVKRWIAELESAGVITRTRATGKRGRPTTYQLHHDRLGATDAPNSGSIRGHKCTEQRAIVAPNRGRLGASVAPPSEQIHPEEQIHRTTKREGGTVAPRHQRAAPPTASNDTSPRPSWPAEADALRGIPGYPFDEAKDRQVMDSLAEAYGQIDLAKELREMKAWLTAKGLLPLRGQTGPRQRVYRWMQKADQISPDQGDANASRERPGASSNLIRRGHGRAAADSWAKRVTAGPRDKDWHAV